MSNESKSVVIDERLAGALLTLLRMGTFPFQHGQIREVEDALLAAVNGAGVAVEVVSDEVAKADVERDFEGGLV